MTTLLQRVKEAKSISDHVFFRLKEEKLSDTKFVQDASMIYIKFPDCLYELRLQVSTLRNGIEMVTLKSPATAISDIVISEWAFGKFGSRYFRLEEYDTLVKEIQVKRAHLKLGTGSCTH